MVRARAETVAQTELSARHIARVTAIGGIRFGLAPGGCWPHAPADNHIVADRQLLLASTEALKPRRPA
jgi:hypothetical protein